MSELRADLERLLERGDDSALLRFSLGNACRRDGELEAAIAHLRAAVERDPGYSAAWKALGGALADAGERDGAREAWREGIAVAEHRGDKQAAREMQVFLRRLERAAKG